MDKFNKNHFAVIMAGGIGSRFWPASTSKHPKQFLDILSCGKSLIKLTYERFARFCPSENIYVVTNTSYIDLVKEHVPEILTENMLGEPVGKNTAPCVAYAANVIHAINQDASIVIAPADHSIGNDAEFEGVLLSALETARKEDWLITLGIQPTRPDTGYGYIQFDEDQEQHGFYKVKTFTEKPDKDTAERFISLGEFLWNSGIFIWSSKAILNSIHQNLPDMYKLFHPIQKHEGKKRIETIKKAYDHCNSISIDHGILEKASNVYVKPASFDWSDVGTWNALYAIRASDNETNVSNSKQVVFKDAKGNMVQTSSNKLVALNGVQNLIVVESDEVILIADRNNEQAIKQLVNELKVEGKGKFM